MATYTQSSIYDHVLDFMNHPAVKGSIVGAGAMFLATPGINRFNRGRNMPWSEAYLGGQSLAAAGMVSSAASFYVKDLLGGNKETASSFQQVWTSSVAGAVSGLALCPFEAVNQNHKKGMTLTNTAKLIVRNRGVTGLFNGAISMIVRESAWVLMYMTAVQKISENLREKGYNRATSDAFALIFSACIFGFVTTPVNRLRVMKQARLTEGLTKGNKTPSYPQLLPLLFNKDPEKKQPLGKKIVNCFEGAVVRSATSAFAGGLFYYGKEGYDRVTPKRACKR